MQLSIKLISGWWSVVFPKWFQWTGLIFTVGGVILSVAKDWPWVTLLAVLPLLIASIGTSLSLKNENDDLLLKNGQVEGDLEKAEKDLQMVTTNTVLRIEEAVERLVTHEILESICESASYVGRIQKLQTSSFDVREVTMAGQDLILAAKVSAESIEKLRKGDEFEMLANRNGFDHLVARARVRQINREQESIFLQVSEDIDSDVMSPIRALSQTGGMRGMEDLHVSVGAQIESMAEFDMSVVANGLKCFCENVIKSKQSRIQ